MTKLVDKQNIKEILGPFFAQNRKPDLITTYLFYLEQKFDIKPVVYLREKKIHRDLKEVLAKAESEGKLWRETQIKIQMGQPSVNENTKKIYICPFTGKVFGDNTHPNPQDAIYDWVSKCPENTERANGLKVKRFYVSEDPDLIKTYIKEVKKPVEKTVYSSTSTGKLFHSKNAAIDDFIQTQTRSLSLVDVPSQNRFQIEDQLMGFIQEQLDETKISEFVESVSQHAEFSKVVGEWLEEK